MPRDASRRENRSPSGDSASIASIAAHFDVVATSDPGRRRDVPLDATRQQPARRASFAWFDAWLQDQPLNEKHVLDLGCGRGEVSVQAALLGAHVTGIDISRESLTNAEALAREHKVAHRVTLQDGNAEHMAFGNDRFDLAVSAGVMSFVDFDRAIAELARVIKRDGTAVILDTLGHNPIARMGRRRRLVAGQTTRFQVENTMTCNHLDRLRAHFGAVDVHVFDLLTVPMILVENLLTRIHPALPRLCAPVSAGLQALDRILLKWRPLRRYAFRVVVVLKWPRKHQAD